MYINISILQSLMVSEDSPVKDFYPVDFKTDLNGKQQEWEAIVLIPFINEEQLLEAMKPHSIYLSDEEVQRNAQGLCCIYRYDPDMKPYTYTSPWQRAFPDVAGCKVR